MRRDTSGKVAAIASLSTLPFFWVISVTLDVRNVANTKAEMQSAADKAAIMATLALMDDEPDEDIRAIAEHAMQQKVSEHTDGLTCELTDFSLTNTRTRVNASWSCTEPSPFAALAGSEAMQFTVATATQFNVAADGCVLALGTSNWTGVDVTGSANVSLSCAVISNSRSTESIALSGSGSLTASCAYAAGGIPNAAAITTTNCLDPIPNGRALVDPYNDISVPDDIEDWPCQTPTKIDSRDLFLQSGKYCSTVSAKGDLELETGGTFVFDGADLEMKSGWAAIHGDNVTLIFMNAGEFQNANGGAIDLSAKLTGEYAGILMYGDRETMPSSIDIQMNGNATSILEGVLYFPNNHLTFNGGAASGSPCTMLVADTVTFSGNADLASDCAHLNAKTFGSLSDIRIVH
ncbi:hypothetical protein [Henriciella litoralis]|uniref:hypothetical protein n=1 Tax=Henriciella litoralis TaxID=568102 RepID=UPI000A03063C|nr:hypothetical protein [Henriciella litoralis]